MGGPGDASKALGTGNGAADALLSRIGAADALRSADDRWKCRRRSRVLIRRDPGDAADALCTVVGTADALCIPWDAEDPLWRR